MTAPTPALRPCWSWCALAVTGLAVAVFVATGGDGAGVAVSAVVVLLASISAWVGATRHLVDPIYRWSLAGCAASFVLSESTRRATSLPDAPPALVDLPSALGALPSLFAAGAYVSATVFVVAMVRRALPRAHGVLWTDALLVAAGAGLAAWSFVLTPALDGGPVVLAVVELVWVSWDALFLALVVQLTVRPVARVPAFWFMLLGFACLLVGELFRGAVVSGALTGVSPALTDSWHLAALGLVAAMSLHPSIADLRADGEDVQGRTGPARLAVSYLALIVPTVVLLGTAESTGLAHQVRSAAYVGLVSVVFLRMVAASARLVKLQRATRQRADHDDLTGLLNRAASMAALERRAAAAHESGTAWHLLFVDLDHFKQVNDTWSHAAGDAVLQQVASRLRTTAGADAVIGRIGGDEFVVGTDADPMALAERIRAACAVPFLRAGGDPLAVTCSVGVATADEAGRTRIDGLLADADVAMYAAKSAARGSVRRFSAADRDQISTTERLRQDLEGALDRGELAVHLQPLVTLGPGGGADHVVGYEALLRWTSAVHGPVGPDVFVPVADAAGLMERIGTWVLHQACAHLRVLRAADVRSRDGAGLYVSVNLTARQLADPLLPQVVADALRAHDVPAGALWLELTESSMVRDTVATHRNIDALRELGVVFALDDFGTGFASLAHLHDLSCQVVKIDRSFVARLHDHRSGEAIVRSIIAMSHALDLTVVAEGVETPWQSQRLSDLGVDVLQGFLYGHPAPLSDYTAAPVATHETVEEAAAETARDDDGDLDPQLAG